MKSLIKCILIITLLNSCSFYETVLLKSVTEKYIITEIDPPKRFYLSFRRLSDNKVFQRIYIAKRCHNYYKVKIGDTLEITENFYKEIIHSDPIKFNTYSSLDIVKLRTQLCYSL